MPTVEAPPADAPTLDAGHLPHTNDRDRRRATFTLPRLSSGRYLAVEDGDEVVVTEIGDRPMRLGRSPAADIMLEHLSVSRRHAVVATRGEVVVVLDDRSLNGVVVNGDRVGEAVLAHGDEIRLGDVAIRYLEIP
jgi:pSer/pThr/pTyr-binding forkhead associated (FHA) protein